MTVFMSFINLKLQIFAAYGLLFDLVTKLIILDDIFAMHA